MSPDKNVYLEIIFLISQAKHMLKILKKNRLICLKEMALLSTQNICLNRWIRKLSNFYDQKFCLADLMKVERNLR